MRVGAANIYAELAGYGLSGDGFHITSPQERGAGGRRCMRMALDMGGISADELDSMRTGRQRA